MAGTPTIASPTQPFVSAIHDGKTGLLADTEEDWYLAIRTMVDTPEARQAIAERAFYDALSHYGHEAHVGHMTTLIESLMYTGRAAARAFRRNIGHPARSLNKLPEVPPHRTIFENDKLGTAQVTVVIPLHNYEHFVVETLETIKAQSLDLLDLIVVDDASTDASCEVARQWLIRNQDRFNRVLLVQNAANAKLARTRNVGFAAAETPLVLPVDADNILLAECVDSLLHAIQADDAEFSYSVLQQFGEGDLLMGLKEYNPIFLIRGNYIDAMALIRKSAWAAVGGYDHIENGWEDYDLWLKFAEHGFYGTQVPAVLAGYRVHAASMLRTQTELPERKIKIIENITARHPWTRLLPPVLDQSGLETDSEAEAPAAAESLIGIPHIAQFGLTEQYKRLEELIPILLCPETAEPLEIVDHISMRSAVSHRMWPIFLGRPNFLPEPEQPHVFPDDHVSHPIPERAKSLIRETSGLVLNLSAGGSRERDDRVIEVETGIFRHTNVVADAHSLPFSDNSFDLVIAMNAFEHYHTPATAAKEIERILRPGGRVLIRTAFLQPLHEAPHHFYNCTRYGLERWFSPFKTIDLHVSDNFNPVYAIAWLMSETEAALRGVGQDSANAFAAARCEDIIRFWRDPQARDGTLWKDFFRIPASQQEAIAAGFEYLGSKAE